MSFNGPDSKARLASAASDDHVVDHFSVGGTFGVSFLALNVGDADKQLQLQTIQLPLPVEFLTQSPP